MLQINSTADKTQIGTQAGPLVDAFDRAKVQAKASVDDAIQIGGKKFSDVLGQILPNELNKDLDGQKPLSIRELVNTALPESASEVTKLQGEAVDLRQLTQTQVELGVNGELSPRVSEQALANFSEARLQTDVESKLNAQELRGQAMAFVQASLKGQSESLQEGVQVIPDLESFDFTETSDQFTESLTTLVDRYLPESSQASQQYKSLMTMDEGSVGKATGAVPNSAMGFVMSALATNSDKPSQIDVEEGALGLNQTQAESSVEMAENAKQQFAREFTELVESEFGKVPESSREWQKLVEQSLAMSRSEQRTVDLSESNNPEIVEDELSTNARVIEDRELLAVEKMIASNKIETGAGGLQSVTNLADNAAFEAASTVEGIDGEALEDALVPTSTEVKSTIATEAGAAESEKVSVAGQGLTEEQSVQNSLNPQTGSEIDESIEQAEVNFAAQTQTTLNSSNQQSSANTTASATSSIDSGRTTAANQVGQQMAGDSRQDSRQDARQESQSDSRQNVRQDLPAGEVGKSNANSEATVNKTASNTQQMAQQLSSLMAQGKSAEMQDKIPMTQMMQAQQKGLDQQANLRAVEASLNQATMLDADGRPLTESLLGDRRATLPPGLQSIPLPVKHPQWGQALGQRVVYMANSQLQQAQITLNPEKLGPIQIKLHMDRDQQIQVSLNAQHGTTKEAMEAAIPRLREMLEQNGVNLSSVDVGDFSQFAEEQMSDESSENQNSGIHTADSDENESLTTAEQVLQTESDQLVDYYA